MLDDMEEILSVYTLLTLLPTRTVSLGFELQLGTAQAPMRSYSHGHTVGL